VQFAHCVTEDKHVWLGHQRPRTQPAPSADGRCPKGPFPSLSTAAGVFVRMRVQLKAADPGANTAPYLCGQVADVVEV
jgi:hypothetical protein